MAYAALVSLANTINHFLKHHLIDLVSTSLEEKEHIICLLEHVNSVVRSLEEFPDKFNSLEEQMRDLAHEAEDILEYLVWERLFSSSDDENELHQLEKASSSSSDGQKQLKLEKVMEEIDLIARKVEKIKDCLSNNDTQRGGNSSSSSSNTSASSRRDAMVGFDDYVMDVKKRLCDEQSELKVIPICGMGGIGKTTLARNIYNDPSIKVNFDILVWVTVSQDYTAQKILSSLLDSLKEFDKDGSGKTDKEKVYKILKFRRYLVVMDDIWSSEAWDVVRNVFPDDGKGSRVLLTTRLSDVASYPDSSSKVCEVHLMNEDHSWILFKQKVFGVEDCPSELENIGKEIARSCQGLPLAIVVIAGLVSTVSRKLASWQEIEGNVKSAGQNQIEEILSLSYIQLPQYMRPCFLYMGSFPEDEEIEVKKLIRQWVAEGFVKSPDDPDNFEKVAEECLDELVKRNLVLVTKRKWDGRIKSCGLHDLMRDLCIKNAYKSKFFLNMMDKDVNKERFVQSVENERRINVDSSNLKYLSSFYRSTIHSIKCSRYELVKLEFLGNVKLLRVLDAESADVDTSLVMVQRGELAGFLIPVDMEHSSLMELLAELFHLRYLAISYCHFSSIALSDLQNLQTLIVGREKRDNFYVGIDVYLVLDWCMPHLRHVYFYGTISFYDPEETTCSLGSLQTVSYVSHESCTERILKKTPILKRLRVDCSCGFRRAEAACLDDLIHLHRLESLEVYAGCRIEYRPKYYSFTFPMMLKKLIFRDLVFPWIDIAVVGSLPNLRVLKLRGCTCIGGTWETTEGEFPQLEFLLIEQCELENWVTESSYFPRLKLLKLHSCWSLYEIPTDIGEITTLELIEISGVAKKSLVKSAKEIQNEQVDWGNTTLQVICNAESSAHERFDFDELGDGDDDDDDNDDDDVKDEDDGDGVDDSDGDNDDDDDDDDDDDKEHDDVSFP